MLLPVASPKVPDKVQKKRKKKRSKTDDDICKIKHRIAVIGAGASGIIVGKRLKEAGIAVTLFEERKKTGGMWNYDKRSKVNPVYDSVYTQLPKELMEFWGEPWDAEGEPRTDSYQPWQAVCNYLDRVARNAKLEDNTYYQRVVTHVEALGEPGEHKGYNVTTEGMLDMVTRTEFFTGVAICNGHYNKPVLPKFPDQDLYYMAGGKITHSVKYTRAGDDYKNKRIVVVGSGPSARDIVSELVEVGAKVIMSCRQRLWSDYRLDGVSYFTGIKNINDMRIIMFHDGTNSGGPVDEIICCTGYNYYLPFLDQDIAPVNSVAKSGYKGVDNLYLNLFNIKYPTLWFVGLPDGVVPWPLADSQAMAIVSVLNGKSKVPDFRSRIRAYGHELSNIASNPCQSENIHAMEGRKSWAYILAMLEFAKDLEHVPGVVLRARVHSECARRRKILVDGYRKSNYTLTCCKDDFIGGGYFEVEHAQFPLSRNETDLTRQGGLHRDLTNVMSLSPCPSYSDDHSEEETTEETTDDTAAAPPTW